MNVAAGTLLAFWVGFAIGLALVALTVAIAFVVERLNVSTTRWINEKIAEFDAANPQFNEDHPQWNRK